MIKFGQLVNSIVVLVLLQLKHSKMILIVKLEWGVQLNLLNLLQVQLMIIESQIVIVETILKVTV